MFTSGAKLLFGIGGLAALASVVYAASSGDLNGIIVWAVLAAVAVFLGGVLIAERDADVPIPAAGTTAVVPSAPPVSPSLWPLAGAVSIATVVLGLVTDSRMFLLGGILTFATLIEWVVQAWSDRASADPDFNAEVRNTTIQPIEFPVLGAAALGVVILGFSRVMLALTEIGSLLAFITIAVLILAGAVLLAARPGFSKGAVAILLALGGVAIVAGGIAGAAVGQRDIEQEAAAEAEADNTVREVAAKASTLGTITYSSAGAQITLTGATGTATLPVDQLSVPKALEVNVLFVNGQEQPVRLVVNAGDLPTGQEDDEGNPITEPLEYETSLAREGKTTFLTFSIPNAGVYGYRIEDEAGNELASGPIVAS